jgi:hypothetical protein
MESRFDAAAKAFAGGGSRREALRRLGGAAAGAALAALGLGCATEPSAPEPGGERPLLDADGKCKKIEKRCACPEGTFACGAETCCDESALCNFQGTCVCGDPAHFLCGGTACCLAATHTCCGSVCCNTFVFGTERCVDGVCVPRCTGGQIECGTACCRPDQVCNNGVCGCPGGAPECNGICCGALQTCVSGMCTCPNLMIPCGTSCCPTGTICSSGACVA